MKTTTAVLLLVGVNLACSVSNWAQEVLPLPREDMRTNAPAPTPVFDDFIRRLRSCKGLFAQATQWYKVMKPVLEELGYTKEQIKAIKNTLGNSQASIADARLFSDKWLVKHGERLNPLVIYQSLPHDQTSEPTLAVK